MNEQILELTIVAGKPAIRGECDLSNAATIEKWLLGLEDEPIEVDLSGITFIDSSCLRVLLKCKHRNPTMRIVRPSPVALRVLEITKTLDDLTAPPD